MFRNITVLMSACGSPSIIGMIKYLKENGERDIKIVGVDMDNDPTTKYLVDVFYVVPAPNNPDFCDYILDVCKKENVDIYFPNVSAEVSVVVSRKSDFDALGVKLSVSNVNSVEISNNKLSSYKLLEKQGISVPKYYPVRSIQDFIDGCKYMGYPNKPVCLKVTESSGSRGVRIIDPNISRYEIFAKQKPNTFYTSYEDMLSVLKSVDSLDEMMLVEYMKGPEYTVDLLADNGKVLYIAGRENIDSLMSIAQKSVVKYDERAYKTAESIVSLLKMTGNVGFDFLRNESGNLLLTDINPRVTATVSVIAAAGMNLLYLRIKQLLGENLPDVELKYGTYLRRRYHEMYTDINGKLL